jgi:hypothetical protein
LLCLTIESSPYLFWISTPWLIFHAWNARILSHFVGGLFTQLIASFAVQKIVHLIEFYLSKNRQNAFVDYPFGVLSKSLPIQYLEVLLYGF